MSHCAISHKRQPPKSPQCHLSPHLPVLFSRGYFQCGHGRRIGSLEEAWRQYLAKRNTDERNCRPGSCRKQTSSRPNKGQSMTAINKDHEQKLGSSCRLHPETYRNDSRWLFEGNPSPTGINLRAEEDRWHRGLEDVCRTDIATNVLVVTLGVVVNSGLLTAFPTNFFLG